MSATTTALERAVALEELAEFYDDRAAQYVTAGSSGGTFREGSVGHQRTVLGPELREQVDKCRDLARQLVVEHSRLIELVRAWRRLG